MKRTKETSSLMPRHDYGVALQTAVSWMGDRYLLAQPVARLHEERKPFFVESRNWLSAARTGVPANRRH